MEIKKIIKNAQEQAIAATIDEQKIKRLLNRVSLISARVYDMEKNEDVNLQNMNKAIDEAFSDIDGLLKRGNIHTKHGFIAEAAQRGIGNARLLEEGKEAIWEWPEKTNSVEDLVKAGTPIQLKFYNSSLSLDAVSKHMEKYSDYLSNGGKYMIPSNDYDKISRYINMSKNEAGHLQRTSYTEWKKVQEFFREHDISFKNDFDRSDLSYASVQLGRYEETLENERAALKYKNYEHRDIEKKKITEAVTNQTNPTFSAGIKTSLASAAVEGSITMALAIAKRRKAGKKIKKFEENDWKEIFSETGMGTVKGGVRGGTVYFFTNVLESNAYTASALVTASFGVASVVNQYRSGEISQEELFINSEIVCIEAAISGMSSLMGQALIPIPVLGAVIGNSIGTIMFQATKSILNNSEQKLFDEYYAEQTELDKELDIKYKECVKYYNNNFNRYLSLIDMAFSNDTITAFNGSVELAHSIGVLDDFMLDSVSDVEEYFLN